MKKFILLFLLVLILPVSAQTLKTGVTYSFQSVEEEFNNLPSIDMDIIKSNFNDVSRYNNEKAARNFTRDLGNRYVYNVWSEVTGNTEPIYAVNYKNKLQNYWFYYDGAVGWLTNVLVVVPPFEYPYKFYMYDKNGVLVTVGIAVSDNESYTYDSVLVKALHNIGDNSYDKKGNLVGYQTIRNRFIKVRGN